jgi:hypothetical protein
MKVYKKLMNSMIKKKLENNLENLQDQKVIL